MRTSRIFRTIVRVILLILTLSLSLVSFLGGLSAIVILSDPNNINVPSSTPQGNLTLYDPTFNKLSNFDHVFFDLPFNITNAGYFDLEDLQIGIVAYFVYDYDDGNPLTENETTYVKILDHSESFFTIERGQQLKDNFSAYYTNPDNDGFDFTDLPADSSTIDLYAPITFEANITLSFKYSLNLLSLKVRVFNFPLPEDIY